MITKLKTNFTSVTAFVAIGALLLPAFIAILALQNASAANLTTTYLRLNRLQAGAGTSVRLQFTTVGAGATSVAVNFNGADATTWTASSGAVNTTQTTNTSTCATETGDTALPGTLSASGSGSTVTITGVTALSATTTYCVDLTSATAVTNATAGEYHPTITVGSDSSTVALRTISNDQIVVTASVPPTFNFVLSGNTDSFTSSLSTSSVVSTTGRTVTITTNAASGWIAWVKGLNGSSGAATKGALRSAAASNFTIPTTNANALGSASHTLTTNTQDYGLGVTINTDASGGGTVSVDAAYDGTSSKAGVLDPTNFRPIASADGTTTGDVITLTERATIDGAVPAATDYTDTLSVIGAGNF
ncbi:MAG: hypothetical protein AAB462_03585 [Patescibacteria group bacterium]